MAAKIIFGEEKHWISHELTNELKIPYQLAERKKMRDVIHACHCRFIRVYQVILKYDFHSWNYEKVFPMFKLEATACRMYKQTHADTHAFPSSVIMKTLGWFGVTPHNGITKCGPTRQTNRQTDSQTLFASAVFWKFCIFNIDHDCDGEAYFPLHLIAIPSRSPFLSCIDFLLFFFLQRQKLHLNSWMLFGAKQMIANCFDDFSMLLVITMPKINRDSEQVVNILRKLCLFCFFFLRTKWTRRWCGIIEMGLLLKQPFDLNQRETYEWKWFANYVHTLDVNAFVHYQLLFQCQMMDIQLSH